MIKYLIFCENFVFNCDFEAMELYFRVLKLHATDRGGDRDLFAAKVSHEAVQL